MSTTDNPLHKALEELPLWAKLLLCIVDVVYSIDRIIEAAVRKNTIALVLSIVWLFIYPVNLIVDIVFIALRGRWLSLADLVDEEERPVGAKGDSIEAEFKEKDR